MMKRLFLLLVVALCLAACGSRTPHVNKPKSEADLSGKVVGVIAGQSYDIDLTARKDLTICRHPTISECIASLETGRIDVFVADEVAVNHDVQEENGIRLAFVTEKNYPCAFALRKDKQDLETVLQFNEFLVDLRASGELDAIIDKWIKAVDYASVPMTKDTFTVSGKPIRVGTSFTMAPISFRVENQWRGMEVEILTLFAHSIGRPIEFKLYDFAALIPALQSSAIDIAAGALFITEERQKALALTNSYFECHGGYFVLDRKSQTKGSFINRFKKSFNNNILVENRWMFLARGLKVTLEITLFSLFFGTLLGAGLYLMRKSHRKWVFKIAASYSLLMRGIPMVVLLMILFYVIFTGINGLVVAVIAFSMSFASFVAPMMETAIDAVGNGQREAGLALGFTPWQTFRLIIGPQALKRALPHFKREVVSLIKNTSVVGYIAIQDLTRASDMIRSRTFEALFPLFFVTVLYFILAWLICKMLDYLFKIGTEI